MKPFCSGRNSIGYDGYVFDLAGATEATSTGLYMVRHRVYDPGLGRWLERDPAGYVDGTNQYQYVSSRPTFTNDPSGLAWNIRDFLLDMALPPTLHHTLKYIVGNDGQHDAGIRETREVMRALSQERKSVRTSPGDLKSMADKGSSLCREDQQIIAYRHGSKREMRTNLTRNPGLFSYGNGYLTWSKRCVVMAKCKKCCNGDMKVSHLAASCTVRFSVLDAYSDPIDVGYELPGSSPFLIQVRWTETFQVEKDFGDVCEKLL